jgi:tetratricopeptide (TPR) repeat protein
MEKNKFLDPFGKAQKLAMKTNTSIIRRYLFTLLLASLLSGCALPRIVFLDDPLTPEEHINLGVAYEKSQEFDAAIKEYKLASDKLPIAYLYLGNVCFSKGNTDEAESYYRKALDKEPMNADVYNNLAWLYYTKGVNLDEAEILVLKAIELNPVKEDLYSDTLKRIRQKKK